MMTEPTNVRSSFSFYRFEKIREHGIGAAGEHEVLPDKNAQLVAGFVKDVLFIYTTAPYAEQTILALCIRWECGTGFLWSIVTGS